MKHIRILILPILCLSFISVGCSGKTYDEGYDEGYAAGEERGYDSGREDGYNEGYEAGFEEAGLGEESDYDLEFAIMEEFSQGYDLGYDDGYGLLAYREFSDERVADLFSNYMDGYDDGYDERVAEIENGKPFDYRVIPMMEVASSFIDSVGYSYDNGILLIRMNEKDLYQYNDVNEFDFREIMDTVSPGEYFNTHIKNNYEYMKLE